MFLRVVILLACLNNTVFCWSACTFKDSSNNTAPTTHDALRLIIEQSQDCPTDVFALRALLKNKQLTLHTTLVANRGFHNPSLGSFSLFEIVTGHVKGFPIIESGEFFFGHFTDIDEQNRLIANQAPTKGALMIEAIAWDYQKRLFNFYELRGDGEKGQWFYRGNSLDIFADNKKLHLQSDPLHPQFGQRLRCSGCHGQGGPIMKEIYNPYNDWWTQNRPLDFGGRKPDDNLSAILVNLVSAEKLAEHVKIGINKLTQNFSYDHLTWQEQLRPLFCPVEINFISDNLPNDLGQATITISGDFFIDARLLPAIKNNSIIISRNYYQAALTKAMNHFPETNQLDADHAWLTPIKSLSDQLTIQKLVDRGLITEKFVADILAIDITNPVFSNKRCALLSYIPKTYSSNWLNIFINNLNHSKNQTAKELLTNIMDITHTKEFYQKNAERIINQCQKKLNKQHNVEKLYALLAQRRIEIKASEISANPLGQILEPGFRIIFPENNLASLPGQLMLDEDCNISALY
ncbi:rod shape-determining protein MreB [Legionella busanensis]|uniref:Rod shape-determining protein MreB n=1 Tax=Legionella busanensis TaxID=190655 RepID=A0A378JI77_9GAMM|nr:hypothetical protein [Legionella busanensis]STX50378.1 rod shape-determining protein MreB [Legionella busanensis]